ncbi:RNA 3'-terminal-phosphate cyclase [Rhodopirellula maiorica SM1]|uniref:RNA 3'-terminal phosphate cyclase n=1 Tax=Rhodopirellula maiorica SM1 TaxID=1265738 RepID=M5S0E8_9BACT|nr:RNA 3'-terminal phosphate cyclase [Rhodopirellula maiorica]EMI21127.1 RNA 3'-terminal-phosphate cyclase [Rhodopirellula maiorica SM1]
MIEIDGSQGEGGGQILRSSLALAAVTKQPIRLVNIRAGRRKPGLMRQHLTSLRAVGEVCDAAIQGDSIGSQAVTFEPGESRGGQFDFKVGTAGSAVLVAQTVLPALMLADHPSAVTFEGGTHNPAAPPLDFLRDSFLPQLAKMGVDSELAIDAYGFYPAGGGKFHLQIAPCCTLRGLTLTECDQKASPQVTAIVSAIPKSVGQRECDTIRRKTNWDPDCFAVKEVDDPRGPGNVVMIQWASPTVTETFTGFGKVGVKAEHIARGVLRQTRAHIARSVPVGEHLADQLMLPMGLAASQGRSSAFRCGPLSMHSKTHLDVLKIFLDIKVDVQQDDESDSVTVCFQPPE